MNSMSRRDMEQACDDFHIEYMFFLKFFTINESNLLYNNIIYNEKLRMQINKNWSNSNKHMDRCLLFLIKLSYFVIFIWVLHISFKKANSNLYITKKGNRLQYVLNTNINKIINNIPQPNYASISMTSVFIAYADVIPQWKQCYFDPSLGKQLITCAISIRILRNQISQLLILQQACKEKANRLAKYGDQLDQLFFILTNSLTQYLSHEQKIVVMFVQYKMFELEGRFVQYLDLINVLKLKSNDVLLLLQNLDIEALYLVIMVKFNLFNYQKFISDSQNNGYDINEWNTYQCRSMKRFEKTATLFFERASKIYNSYRHFNKKSSAIERQVQKQNEKKLRNFSYESLGFGVSTGLLFFFMSFIILLNITTDSGLGENKVFTQNFPVWRGACLIIFYIWVLGFNLLFFQKNTINYQLILNLQGASWSSSKFFFILASSFSFTLLFLMLLFMFQILGIKQIEFVHYGQIVWLLFIVFIVQPLPILNYKGRFYLIKMLFKQILSFCFPMNFMMIWIAQQIVSLSQPISDFFYSVHFLISKDSTHSKTVTSNFNSGIFMVIFAYRMFQNLKFWHQISSAKPDKHYDFMAPPFLGFCRATFGFLTALTSMIYRLKLFQNAMILWLIIVILATLVAWYVDARGDWGLFIHQERTILRPRLFFSSKKYGYYFMLILNLLLRTAWVLTISSFFVNSTGVQSSLYVLAISCIQIFRRGLWNILRVENEHVVNCTQYQATMKDKNIRVSANNKAKTIKMKMKDKSIESLMKIVSDLSQTSLHELKMNRQVKDVDTNRISTQEKRFKESIEERKQIRKRVEILLKNSDQTVARIRNQLQYDSTQYSV